MYFKKIVEFYESFKCFKSCLLPRCFLTVYHMKIRNLLGNVLDLWPGKDRYGPYRFLPVFFVSGMLIEYAMIHWKPNGVNFYEKFKAKKAREKALERFSNWEEIEELLKK